MTFDDIVYFLEKGMEVSIKSTSKQKFEGSTGYKPFVRDIVGSLGLCIASHLKGLIIRCVPKLTYFENKSIAITYKKRISDCERRGCIYIDVSYKYIAGVTLLFESPALLVV